MVYSTINLIFMQEVEVKKNPTEIAFVTAL